MQAKETLKSKTELIPVSNRVPAWLMPSVKVGIFAFDGILAFICFTTAFYLREGNSIFQENYFEWSEEFLPYVGVLFFIVPIRVLMLLYQGIYQLQGEFSYTSEFIKVFKATLISSLLLISFTFLFRGGFEFREFSYSRGVFLIDFGLALVVFTIFHLGLRYLQTLIRKRGINLIPTLIVGTNGEAEQTIKELKRRKDLGYRIVGVVESESSDKIEISDTPIVGNLESLPKIIKKLAIQEVIITDDKISNEKLFEVMIQSDRKRKIEFRLAPSLFNFLPQKTSVEQIGVLPMVGLFREPLSDTERFIKRFFDIAISTISLIILSPICLLISLLIKLDSKGKILFKQERVGMDGRKFLCYKFRTMQTGADENLHREVYQKNIDGETTANVGNDATPVFGKVKNDPRITKIGWLLRRSSFDEFPQLLNVLKGDMSIVGPRPPISYEVENYEIWHRKRLEMKPGITGLWQVSGRNRLPFKEMVKLDLFYIENWSFWLDIKIILLTFPAMLRGDGGDD